MNCSYTRQLGHPIALTVLFSIFSIYSHAQKTWDGGAGTNNWMDAGNWNDDQLPLTTDDILLVGVDVELNGFNNISVQNIQLCCDATLTIGADAALTGNYASMQHLGTSITNYGEFILNGEYNFGISLGGDTELFNYGNISTYNTGPDGGIKLFGATATNNGSILINGSTGNGDGIHIINSGTKTSVFTNNGTVTIKNTMGDGISGGGIYHNYGTTDITNVTYWNDLLLDGEDGLAFENYSGALFKGDGQLDPTTLNWNGGEMTTDDGNNTPGIVEFYCLGNCNGESFVDANLIFNIDGIEGPGVIDGHDQIQINQNAELGGNIEIILGEGFFPNIGDSFILMTYASKTGGDPIFDFPALPADREWQYNITSTQIEVAVASLLPVELISFTASKEDEHVSLNWSTASEIENRGFFIEKSTDGKDWEYLSFVKGNGNTQFISEYKYEDENPFNGRNYYRLIQSDFDGSQNKSKVVSVNFNSNKSGDEIKIYPNPIHRGEYLFVTFLENEINKVSIISENGQLIFLKKNISEKIKINTSDFPKGIYWVVLENGNEKTTKRFIVSE